MCARCTWRRPRAERSGKRCSRWPISLALSSERVLRSRPCPSWPTRPRSSLPPPPQPPLPPSLGARRARRLCGRAVHPRKLSSFGASRRINARSGALGLRSSSRRPARREQAGGVRGWAGTGKFPRHGPSGRVSRAGNANTLKHLTALYPLLISPPQASANEERVLALEQAAEGWPVVAAGDVQVGDRGRAGD